MRSKIWLIAVLAGLVFALPASAQEPRQVWAFYMGWYTHESWGDGRLLDRPAQPYDSRDGGAIGRQIDEARSAGIDAFIMSWYGPAGDNLTHQVFNSLLDQSAARGFRAAAALDMHESAFNANVGDVTNSLAYLINDRANHPGYLRYNGKPVIYFWNQGRFSVADWRNIRNQVDPNRNTIWVAEGTNTAYIGVFDGLYLFNTAWAANPAAVAQQWMRRVNQAGGTFYTPTVLPGWDEQALAAGRSNPTSPQDRAGGQFLTRSWNGAVSSGANVILIVSWNEYFENSHIEPSQAFGTAALDILRPLIAAWESGAPAPAAGGAPAGSPTGVTYAINSNLRLRSAPVNGDVITTVPYNTVLDVVGRTADNNWVQVNYNGQSGWMSAGYGTFNGDLNAAPVTG
ncbi:MAG TPA: endo-1,3-alpha-glucanase family glycosylhydrolase [Oceanobacillus sp.]|nr:endo-1,3-alpha-glucanase family glycosylhydrolase [Oceanobacillus sp.]